MDTHTHTQTHTSQGNSQDPECNAGGGTQGQSEDTEVLSIEGAAVVVPKPTRAPPPAVDQLMPLLQPHPQSQHSGGAVENEEDEVLVL